jgi:hypothetical protein
VHDTAVTIGLVLAQILVHITLDKLTVDPSRYVSLNGVVLAG